MERLSRLKNFVLPVSVMGCLLVILMPLPAVLMDYFLAFNIALAVIVILTAIYVQTPLEFSVFPALLLATTLFRLVLNIATTRLILTRAADDGMLAAGGVVRSFGKFIASDHVVVGLVIFLIIMVVQFVVITKGATRISEVAARFALDGMPGRQMAIDAELTAGTIDKTEAQRRRSELTQQADFYGAMDGASKFVRGDAIAGIFITAINIVGGLLIGVTQYGMSLFDASSLFTILTIGDGLVSQVPALLISLAAALLVSRSTQRVDLPIAVVRQLFMRPEVLTVAGGFLGLLVLTKLPAIPLLTLGGGCLGLAWLATRQRDSQSDSLANKTTAVSKTQQTVEDFLAVDPLEVELGVGLISLADPKRGGDLLSLLTEMRHTVAADIGIVVPKVRVRDNLGLGRHHYRLKMASNRLAEAELDPQSLLAIATQDAKPLSGKKITEPAYERPAYWISVGQRQLAQRTGYAVMSPPNVMVTHLKSVIQSHAAELLTRDATQNLVDQLRKKSPVVVDELIPDMFSLSQVQKVLQNLLHEDIPIKQLGLIFEALGDNSQADVATQTEMVRRRLARTISSRFRDDQYRLNVFTLTPELETALEKSRTQTAGVTLTTTELESLCQRIGQQLKPINKQSKPPVLLVKASIRTYVRQLTQTLLPRLAVLSYAEVTEDTHVVTAAIISDKQHTSLP